MFIPSIQTVWWPWGFCIYLWGTLLLPYGVTCWGWVVIRACIASLACVRMPNAWASGDARLLSTSPNGEPARRLKTDKMHQKYIIKKSMWTQLYLLPKKYLHNFSVLHIYSSSSKVHVQLSSSWKIFTRSFFSVSLRWMIDTVKVKRRKETGTLDTAKTGNRKVTFKLNNYSWWENSKRKSMQRRLKLHLTCTSVAVHYDQTYTPSCNL